MFILLSICLLAQPDRCREERISLSYEAANPVVCLRNAQSRLATWQAEHPEWQVNRWRCALRGGMPKDL
ncbi:MAG TPA: hypothetical protein VF641_01395 [Methylobacterium sp.]